MVSGGDLIDVVRIDSDEHARGETAGMALPGVTKGLLRAAALRSTRGRGTDHAAAPPDSGERR